MSKGKLIIISGFSGVGKGTVIKKLIKDYPGKYAFSVSATSRNPRPGEEHGREYYFISCEEFEELISSNKLLEYNIYNNNYYGTPAEPVEKLLAEGRNIILDIDINGMHQVIRTRPDVLKIFFIPPTAQELLNRLSHRGTENAEQIAGRLKIALSEGSNAGEYDYILINRNVDETKKLLNDIVDDVPVNYNKNAQTALTAAICEEIKKFI